MHRFRFLLLFLLVDLAASAQMPLSQVRQQPLGTTVTFRGVVLNGAELGVIRYVQDPSGGIGLYDPTNTSVTNLNRGDSVEVTGLTVEFQNLLEITPVSNLTLISSSNNLPAPQTVTPAQLAETLESELVILPNVQFINAGTVISGNTSYTFETPGGAQAATMYVRTNSPLVGLTLPTGLVTLRGICSQFAANYQLIMRDAADFILPGSIFINSAVTTSAITQTGFNLHWTTNIAGSTGVRYGLTPALELGTQTSSLFDANHTLTLSGLQAGNIYYCKAFSVSGTDTAWSALEPFGTQSSSTGNIKVYFNRSVNTSVATTSAAIELPNAIDDTLVAYIDRAERTLDLTIYDFDNTGLNSISAAINAAKNRGVKVRFISDGSEAPTNTGVNDLQANVPRLASPVGNPYGIMHNKFVVIDAFHPNPNKSIVWTGSTNWTARQINRDPNSVVIVQDQTLAKAYTMEFEEMWGDTSATPNAANSKFGPDKTDNTPHQFKIGNREVELYFSPSDGTNNFLLSTIQSATQNMFFATMLITRSDLANAIGAQVNAGLTVEGLIDDAATSTQYGNLSGSMGSNLHVNEDTTVIMHHKHLIVDHNVTGADTKVWVGSHNWSTNANARNDENTLIIHDATIANWFYQEFTKRLTDTLGSSVITALGGGDAWEVRLHPNPAKLSEGFWLNVPERAGAQAKLFTLDGRLLGTQTLVEGMNRVAAPLVGLNPGMYILETTSGGKRGMHRITLTE